MSDRGFPSTSKWLRSHAYFFARRLHRRRQLQQPIPANWKKSFSASYDWFLAFKKRHPRLALRVPEGLSKARAEAFNKERVETFFNDVKKVYQDLNLENCPSIIYNCDETGLSTVPGNSTKVLALKGNRQVQKITIGERGTLTTLLPALNACGDSLPPFLIFKGKLIPDTSKFPEGTAIHCSPSGYIDQDIFLEFLRHFNKHRVHIEGKQCLLFLDGHKSHVNVEAAEFCVESGIELLCLPPHSTHRLQPLDTHYNKVLKQKWADVLSRHFSTDVSNLSLPREQFHCVFNKVWDEMIQRRGLIVDAFAHCGLFPAKNTVGEKEYEKSKIFNTTDTAESQQQNDSNASLLRTIMNSPKVKSNGTNRKPHMAHITSPQNIKTLKQKEKPKRLEENTQRGFPKLRIRLFDNKPVTDRPSTPRENESTNQNDTECCVCAATWSTTSEDWYQCKACKGWACESCFAVDMCADCM